jgi:Asp-tRNA(Asn)/Glu-tRNA(Gln) amidotransferase A subunit family amidase
MTDDLHAQRQALAEGLTSLPELLGQAMEVSQSAACLNVYLDSPVPALQQAIANQSPNQSPSEVSRPIGPLAGLPVSIKDLFDVAGQPTRAGSKVLSGAAPAPQDCTAIARLRAAGGLIAGRTHMVEFAFSGVGTNPHHGTPVNPADPRLARVPGGSSSGAAVSVATGAAAVGLGSDTGGSIRIPAALCGVVGFKSTARLVPAQGCIPLSTTLDTVCALTRSVRDAITVHQILAARSVQRVGKPLSSCRLALPQTLMQDDMDATVAAAFERSLRLLRQAGAQIEEVPLQEIAELAAINASGGFSAAESYAWHRRLLAERQKDYDPRVALRILRGADMSAADYIELIAARTRWVDQVNERLAGFDAIISPTVPIVAPSIASVLQDDTEFFRVNSLLLRNTAVVNMLDGCGVSLPCHQHGELPVGLMLWHGALKDDQVLDLALQVEQVLRRF